MLICTFAGHSNVYSGQASEKLDAVIEELLENTDEAVFYVGGRGEFDGMAARAVRGAKNRHKDKKIQLLLVEPYMSQQLNIDKYYFSSEFDGIVIPTELAGAYPKAAIKKRNRLMVDWSDVLIAYVYRDYGGAYETLKYAQRKELVRIINLAESLNTKDIAFCI